MPTETDLSLKHIQAELARIDLLVRQGVCRRRQTERRSEEFFPGLHISEEEVDALMNQPFGVEQRIELTAEELPGLTEAKAQAVAQIKATLAAARATGQRTRLEYLEATFGLDPFEMDVFLICLAPALDLRYERLFSYLQDDITRRYPTINLILTLLAATGVERFSLLRHFTDQATLFKHQLLAREGEANHSARLSQILLPDPTVVAWLLGGYTPSPDLSPHFKLSYIQESEEDYLLAGSIGPELEQIAPGPSPPPLLIFYGPDQLGQSAAARLLAAKMKRPLVTVDLHTLLKAGLSPQLAIRLILRDARLLGAIPCLTTILEPPADGPPQLLPDDLLEELYAYPDLAIIAGWPPWQAQTGGRTLFWFEFPLPNYSQRCVLWHHFLSQSPHFELSQEPFDIPTLAGQFMLSSSQIRNVVTIAKDRAIQHNRPPTNNDLFVAARNHSTPRLGTLAHKITPRYGWNDIILPGDQVALLREIVTTIHERPRVLEEWGVGQKLVASNGITILFAGPPGTGKTMAAEIIAAELKLDLYKIELSTIVSKYIGETEKNLERIFQEAQSSNAILFFDEADAIFGKRSEVKDAHDRYANIEVSYLLQRMEAYDGVTILATNLRSNLDEAFTRRIQYAIDFPFPEAPDRLRIWETLFPPDLPRAPDLDFNLLSRRFRLAGGSIRNIIVNAAYLAAADGQQVTMNHLLHSMRRELQKMGRLINEAELKLSKF